MGGMQLVIHSPFGSRINRAWGLALRKRFCRKFNFELQAAATEDAIVLSLSTSHSFALEDVAHYLHSNSVRPLLIQAMLDAPMFTARWRWNATTALALPRFRSGKKVAPQLQRMGAEDLMATVFPDQIACAENLVGEREVPDHPLVRQTVHDCLYDAMDIEGLENMLRGIESGAIETIARDVTEPSPLALEILTARPYAYLDDAPMEERRTRAVMSRTWLDAETAADLGKLDADAIARVLEEAWPDAVSADELHDALLWLTFLTPQEIAVHAEWAVFLEALAGQRRVTRVEAASASLSSENAPDELTMWIAAERLPLFQVVYPDLRHAPPVEAPEEFAARIWTREEAIVEMVRGRLEGSGPVMASALAASMRLPLGEIDIALAKLAAEGFVMRGVFTPGTSEPEWCERRLLARIHRYTVKRLRAEIEAVPSQDFVRFLFRWQRVLQHERGEGPDALAATITQLEGVEAPAAAWEADILPARLNNYEFTWLDDLCLAGRAIWTRLTPPMARHRTQCAPIRTTPVTLLPRRSSALWAQAVLVRRSSRRCSVRAHNALPIICARTVRRSSTRWSMARHAAHPGGVCARRAGRPCASEFR
jgi:ATP-dependent Lhr-like helicase